MQVDGEYNYVYVYVELCDDSKDWITDARDNPQNFQRAVDPATSTMLAYLSRDGGHIASTTSVFYAQNQAQQITFKDVVPGDLRVSMETPRGYSVFPIVYCSTWFDSDTVATPSYRVEPVSDSSFDVPVMPGGQFAICGVSFVPTDRESTVDVVVHACPADFNRFYVVSQSERAAICSLPIPDTYVTVSERQGYSTSFYARADDPVASFPMVKPGFVYLRGTTATNAGYGLSPSVFCSSNMSNGDPLGLYQNVPLTTDDRQPDRTIVYEIHTSKGELYCDWFLFPQGGEPDPSINDAALESSTPTSEVFATGDSAVLTVQFWECDLAPASDDYTTYLSECSTVVESREVTLGTENGTATESIEDENLTATVPVDGTLSVVIDDPAAAVFCSLVSDIDGEITEQFPELVESSNATLTLTAEPGTTTIYCDWFTIES